MPPFRLLLTAFGPFPNVPYNPSKSLALQLAQLTIPSPQPLQLYPLTLPTSYHCHIPFLNALQHLQPHAILSLGVRKSTPCLQLEQIAKNWQHSPLPDAHNYTRYHQPILHHAPKTYHSTLPTQKLYQTCQQLQIPIQLSQNAGTYVCNHLFFYALHTLQNTQSPTPMGFLHIPLYTNPQQLLLHTSLLLHTLLQTLQTKN